MKSVDREVGVKTMDLEQLPRLAQLMDLYGGLLNERRQEILRFYYDEDLSLSEVAEQLQISRQAVHDHLNQGRRQLDTFEERLGLLALRLERDVLLGELEQKLERWAGQKLPSGLRHDLRRLKNESLTVASPRKGGG